jgi:predicted AlkP superfamily pyrophosphatase or phosphodiesterase
VYVGNIIEKVKEAGIFDDTHFLLLSEYGFNDVKDAIPINRILREKGLLQVRTINGKEYIDYEFSDAFAMVDHQIAHIYINDSKNMGKE